MSWNILFVSTFWMPLNIFLFFSGVRLSIHLLTRSLNRNWALLKSGLPWIAGSEDMAGGEISNRKIAT